ncbi:MAG TPA: hypothetical protein VK541_13760 [Pedobacter sp.]|uniref:hypothetical protein n=1 Tax=Pedobacter sp. TaxID=1411316 RepID=UPI002C789CB7|nr:hypothetical protein [Pedobacter sp.]HMI03551.1 hypothetical protein [Pedobacter sp.]
MKVFFLLVLTTLTFNVLGQNVAVTGAWELRNGDEQHQLFFQDGFYLHTVHNGSQFVSSQGGNYEVKDNTLKGKLLFNTADSTSVGTSMDVQFSVSGGQLSLDLQDGRINFNRLDDGKAPLAGVWRITGRKGEDGKLTDIHQSGTRQTYKMLTGTKFQWVAIDPGKKQFSGTGGGSYTFKDGKYTENIEFFSRDNTRVGASLVFDGKLEDGNWHHSGLSSKGAKIYEVWSRVKE